MVTYRICVEEHLDPQWCEWFYGVTIRHLPGGRSALLTPPVDQSTVHSILNRIRDLNLTLVSVERLGAVTPTCTSKGDMI